MTPFEALVRARQHGVSVRVADGRLHIAADGPVPRHVVEALRGHREDLIDMLSPDILGDRQWADAWLTMAEDLAKAHTHLAILAARRTGRGQDRPAEREAERLYWQAFDHICHTRCERQHLRCNACGLPLPRPWLHWPWLHGECRLEQVDR